MKFFTVLPVVMTLFTGICQGQETDTTNASIRYNLTRFIQATEDKNWEGVLDLTYPKLFDLAPKEQMLALFQQMEDSGMKFNFENMKVDSISGIFGAENQKFAKVGYTANMTISFEGEMYGDDVMPFLKSSFETTYGAENVSYDKDHKTFKILAVKSLYAITEPGAENWFFLENNPEQEVILNLLIPEAVRNHFSKQ